MRGGEERSGQSRWRRLCFSEVLPDPHGLVGFFLAVGVFFAYIVVPTGRAYLLSENPVVEVAAHVGLLLGPPLALYLGLRHLLVRGTSLIPLLTVPLGLFLSLVTAVGVTMALVSG